MYFLCKQQLLFFSNSSLNKILSRYLQFLMTVFNAKMDFKYVLFDNCVENLENADYCLFYFEYQFESIFFVLFISYTHHLLYTKAPLVSVVMRARCSLDLTLYLFLKNVTTVRGMFFRSNKIVRKSGNTTFRSPCPNWHPDVSSRNPKQPCEVRTCVRRKVRSSWRLSSHSSKRGLIAAIAACPALGPSFLSAMWSCRSSFRHATGAWRRTYALPTYSSAEELSPQIPWRQSGKDENYFRPYFTICQKLTVEK